MRDVPDLFLKNQDWQRYVIKLIVGGNTKTNNQLIEKRDSEEKKEG